MEEITLLEDSIWEAVGNAVREKDSFKATQWQSLIPIVEKLKNEIEKVEKSIASRGLAQKPQSIRKSASWIVTEGAIGHNYLSTGEASKAGLLPAKGAFKVTTSTGRTFETDVTAYHLRERGEIARFYRDAGILPGDKVEWREIKANEEYFLSKVK